MLEKSELAVIHIAKTELKLKEDDYRYILQSNFKKDSSRDLNKVEFLKIMEKYYGKGNVSKESLILIEKTISSFNKK